MIEERVMEIVENFPKAKGYPIKPIGEWIICRRLPDSTKQTLIVPPGAKQVDMVIAKVLVVGMGTMSIMGQRIPMDVREGDLIVFAANQGHLMDYGLRKHLIDRGVAPEELEETLVVLQQYLLGVIDPLKVASEGVEHVPVAESQ